MVMALAFDEAKKNQIRIVGDGQGAMGGLTQTRFFGGRDKPDLPSANLAQLDPGRYFSIHYHSLKPGAARIAARPKPTSINAKE
jgi:hypothetical protein